MKKTLCVMMLAAMFFTSVVFTFRDCFEPPYTPQQEEAPHDTPPPSPPDAPPAGPL